AVAAVDDLVAVVRLRARVSGLTGEVAADEAVVAAVAGDRVVAESADDEVAAGAAVDRVPTVRRRAVRSSADQVVAPAAVDRVGAGRADDHVGSIGTEDGPGTRGDDGRRGVHTRDGIRRHRRDAHDERAESKRARKREECPQETLPLVVAAVRGKATSTTMPT